MTRTFDALCIATVAIGGFLQARAAENQPEDQQRQIQAIIQRVDGGETSALLELGNVGSTNLIPILEKYVAPAGRLIQADPAQRDFAASALAKLGAEKHYQQLIRQRSLEQDFAASLEIERSFRILSHIPTKAAVRAVAQFLYDPSAPKRMPSDVVAASNQLLAARILGGLHGKFGGLITNSPTAKDPATYDLEDVKKWQQWWEANKTNYSE